jgi:hypothetical protein
MVLGSLPGSPRTRRVNPIGAARGDPRLYTAALLVTYSAMLLLSLLIAFVLGVSGPANNTAINRSIVAWFEFLGVGATLQLLRVAVIFSLGRERLLGSWHPANHKLSMLSFPSDVDLLLQAALCAIFWLINAV